MIQHIFRPGVYHIIVNQYNSSDKSEYLDCSAIKVGVQVTQGLMLLPTRQRHILRSFIKKRKFRHKIPAWWCRKVKPFPSTHGSY